MTCSFEENNFMEYKDILARKEKKDQKHIHIIFWNVTQITFWLAQAKKKEKKKKMKLTV